jgi:hypothetical protein
MRTLCYLFFLILVTVASCSPVVYSTIGQNVPLFRSKGEVSADASIVSSDDGDGGGFQFAAAPGNNFAIITSFYSLANKTSGEWRGQGSYFEFGAGRFGYLDPGKKTFITEVFLGMGFGGIKNEDQNSASRVDVTFIKPFVQPSIGISGKWYDVALTPRFALVSYTNNTITVDDPQYQTEAEQYFDDKKNTFVFEPGITIRLGYKSVRGQFQYNASTFSYRENSDVNINNQFVSAGIHWLISKRFQEE